MLHSDVFSKIVSIISWLRGLTSSNVILLSFNICVNQTSIEIQDTIVTQKVPWVCSPFY